MFLPHFQLQTNILSLTLRSLPFSHLKLLIYRDYQHQHCAIYSSATFLLLLGNFLSFSPLLIRAYDMCLWHGARLRSTMPPALSLQLVGGQAPKTPLCTLHNL
jgi:hypothetical protein